MKKQFLNLFILLSFFTGMFAQTPLEFDQLNHIGGFGEDLVLDLVTDSEGNTYVLIFLETIPLYSNDSIIGINPTAYLLIYGPNGNLEFSYEFIAQGEDSNIFMDKIGILNDGHVVCVGSFSGEFQFGDTLVESSHAVGLICNFLPDGLTDRVKLFNVSEKYTKVRNLTIDNENNIYLTGLSLDSVYYDQNQNPIIVITDGFRLPVWKYDVDFNLQWIKVFYGDYSMPYSRPIIQDQEQNLIFTAYLQGLNLYYDDQVVEMEGDTHKILVKLSMDGEVIWIHSVDGESSSTFDICADMDNNIYLASSFNDAIKYGDQTFHHTFNSPNETYVLSVNANGDFRWQNQVHCINYSVSNIYPSQIHANGNDVFLSGNYRYNAFFDEILLQKVSPVYHHYDTYITKINTETGAFIWANGIYGGNLGVDYKIPFSVDDECNITASVYFSGQATFGDSVIQSYGDRDILVTRLDEVITGINSDTDFALLHTAVYPNPGSDQVFVKNTKGIALFRLFNLQGKMVLSTKIIGSLELEINTSELYPGIYFFQLTDESGTEETGKWIKQ